MSYKINRNVLNPGTTASITLPGQKPKVVSLTGEAIVKQARQGIPAITIPVPTQEELAHLYEMKHYMVVVDDKKEVAVKQ